ncbi:MAG TPA: sigma-70 family RNA polymerase sigma factor [Planctomycetota bacterium]|nr:sigma-70 family RNA polymerase sigma factor [Planctomycetota bacterium]
MENLDDALRRAQQGDPDAYGAVVAATQARLRSFIAGYVPRAAWVDDLAQQAFISAYQNLGSFRVGSDFYAWLRQIAFNHLRAELEKTRRRKRLESDYLVEIAASEMERRLARDPGEEEALDALRDCVSRLPDTSRDIVRRHYGDGSPLAEIAGSLGRPAGSLKVTLFKIRVRLKECIERKRADARPGMSGHA